MGGSKEAGLEEVLILTVVCIKMLSQVIAFQYLSLAHSQEQRLTGEMVAACSLPCPGVQITTKTSKIRVDA
jgi:hypothetical protein